PTNDNLMEILVMVDALKRSSAGRITAAIPYFGYSRQDRRPRSARVPITAKVVADMLSSVGVNRVMTMDLHADQIQGFFNIPVDNIYATPVLLGDLWKQNYENLLVVSPDVGGVVRARAIAKRLDSDLAIIDKRRPKANVAEVMNIIGDVEGRTCRSEEHTSELRHYTTLFRSDNIYATPVLLGDLWKQNYENLLVVSPDVGGVVRARAIAKRLDSDLAIIDKRRPKANVAEVMNIIGDVEGRTC